MFYTYTSEALNLRLFQALGKTGKVIKIYSDGDLRVALDGHTWTFNPLSVVPVSSGTNAPVADNGNRDRTGTCIRIRKTNAMCNLIAFYIVYKFILYINRLT